MSLASGEAVTLIFHDTERGAVIDGAAAPAAQLKPAPAARPARPAKPPASTSNQGDLF